MQREAARRDVFERYIGEISQAVNAINRKWKTRELYEALLKQAKKRTAIADARLDEEGKMIKQDEVEQLKKDQGVVLVESRAPGATPGVATSVAASSPSDDGDLVRLKSKKKPRKRPKNQ